MGLRERLASLFACRCDPIWTDRRLHSPECIEELQGDVADIVAAWLRDEEIGDLFAEATEQHHIVNSETDAMGNSPCVCGRWWDSDQGPGWDQHLAYVGLRALADSITGSTDGH